MSYIELRVGNYVVMSAAACMPASCKWGGYRRVALIELEPGSEPPKIITSRAKQVRSVVRVWDRLNDGHTSRCAYRRALTAACEMAREYAGV